MQARIHAHQNGRDYSTYKILHVRCRDKIKSERFDMEFEILEIVRRPVEQQIHDTGDESTMNEHASRKFATFELNSIAICWIVTRTRNECRDMMDEDSRGKRPREKRFE